MSNTNRIIGFDVARVFSIVYIIGVYHVLGYAGIYGRHPVVRTFTYASLCIFTFISSFLLTSKYTFESKKEILCFYKKRVLRFYPLFFIASVLLYLLGVNNGIQTMKGLLGISPFIKPHPITMWYCAMLISLYLLTPFLATGGWKKQFIKFSAVMGIIILIEVLFHSVVPRTYWYFLVYFVGIIVAQQFGVSFLSFLKRNWIILMVVFLAFVVLTFITRSSVLKYVNSGVGLFALLSLYLKIGDWIENKDKLTNCFLWLSYASMCMYLFHRQVYEVMLTIYHPATPMGVCLYLGLAGVIITIVLSYCIQKTYDYIIAKIIYKVK